MFRKLFTGFSAVLFVLVLLSSCKKEKEELVDSIVTAQDNSLAMLFWDDIYKTVNEESSGIEGIRSAPLTACIDTIMVDTIADPRTITIDFGNDDCSGIDGRVRKGKLIVTYTGRYLEVGTVITTTPENYTIDGYAVNGTKTVTNIGNNDNGEPTFTVSVANANIVAPSNAWTASWESTRTRVWKEGYDTPLFLLDDVYEISGTQTGVNRNGAGYTANIITPLRIKVGCPWIVSGVYQLIPEGLSTRTVDFGNGECDAYVSVTVNGNTYNFTLN